MDPLTNGDYPQSMRFLVKDRLPKFTKKQSKQLNGSFDFIRLNYYTTYYAAYASQPIGVKASYLTDSSANLISKYKFNIRSHAYDFLMYLIKNTN